MHNCMFRKAEMTAMHKTHCPNREKQSKKTGVNILVSTTGCCRGKKTTVPSRQREQTKEENDSKHEYHKIPEPESVQPQHFKNIQWLVLNVFVISKIISVFL